MKLIPWTAGEAAAPRFRGEGQRAVRLPAHPNLAQVYEAGELRGQRFVAMEYIEGLPLSEWAKKEKADLRRRVEILRDVARALDHAHAHGVVHRNVRPANVLVTPEGRPILTAPDLAGQAGTGTRRGAPGPASPYLSPEQSQGNLEVDGRADVYALGAMLGEALTEAPASGPAGPGSGDRAIEAICRKATAKKPGRRYATARALAEDLTAWLEGGRVQVLRQRAARRTAVAAVAAAAVVLTAAGMWLRGTAAKAAQDAAATAEAETAAVAAARKRYEEALARGDRARGLRQWNDALAAYRDAEAAAGERPGRICSPAEEVALASRLEEARRDLAFAPVLDQAEAFARDSRWVDAGAAVDRALAMRPQDRGAERLKADVEAVAAAQKRVEEARRAVQDHAAQEKRREDGPGLANRWEEARSDLAFAEAVGQARALARDRKWAEAWKAAQPALDLKPLSPLAPELEAFALSVSEVATLNGHGDRVGSIAFSPDGRLLASGSADRTIKLWDVAARREVRTFGGHGGILGVAFRPDGRLLASANHDQTVTLWDVATGREERMLKGHRDKVRSVAFSPDGQRLASGSADGTIKVWDPATGREIQTLSDHGSGGGVAFSPDGKLLASGSGAGGVTLWDAATGREVRTMRGRQEHVWIVAFSPDGRRLASGSLNKTISIWEVETGRLIGELRGTTGTVLAVAFSPDGEFLASGGDGQTVSLWDPALGHEAHRLVGHGGTVSGVAFSPDGSVLASASEDQTIKLWDGVGADPAAPRMSRRPEVRILRDEAHHACRVAFSPDGGWLASGNWDGTITLRNSATGRVVRTWKGHKAAVRSIAFSPDGRRLASGSRDQTFRLWEVETGSEVRMLGQGGDELAFSPDGTAVALAIWNRQVTVADPLTGRELQALAKGTGVMGSVAFSPDGKFLASGNERGTLLAWDVPTGRQAWACGGNGLNVSIAFSPDGKWLASGSMGSGGIALVEWGTRGKIRALRGHADTVWSVAFSPNGKMLASGGGDHTIRLWDTATGRAFGTLRGHAEAVSGIAFSPDGERLVSASEDQTLRVWDVRRRPKQLPTPR